jgi:hypothetical protein
MNPFLKIKSMENYKLVLWPESQDFMDEDWFQEEAILAQEGDAAYFIPNKYINKDDKNIHRRSLFTFS